jgi:hypothetical protein
MLEEFKNMREQLAQKIAPYPNFAYNRNDR